MTIVRNVSQYFDNGRCDNVNPDVMRDGPQNRTDRMPGRNSVLRFCSLPMSSTLFILELLMRTSGAFASRDSKNGSHCGIYDANG